jgi:hypothetical protein
MYLGSDFIPEHKVCSPLPYRDDPHPSFIIRVSKAGDLYWRDFGINQEQIGFDAVGLVGELLGVGRQEALLDIQERMESGELPPDVVHKPKVISKHLYGTKLSDWGAGWWQERLFVERDLLDFFHVGSLLGYFRDGRKIWEDRPDMPAFLYADCNKAYRPTAPKGMKHRGIDNGDIMEGWDQLPQTADHFILQTSLKDTIVFRNMGYLGAAPPSENSLAPLFKRAREINGRFSKCFVMHDNDEAGRKQAGLLKELLGWTPISCPTTKDPSDSVEKYRGYWEMSEFMRNFALSKYLRW